MINTDFHLTKIDLLLSNKTYFFLTTLYDQDNPFMA